MVTENLHFTELIGVVESWAKPGGFDNLAFGNAISDNKQVKVKKIKKTL